MPEALLDERRLLRLQRMENALIRAVLDKPTYLLEAEVYRLRYAIGLARLQVFAPGAALQQPWQAEVHVRQDLLQTLRGHLLEKLHPALRIAAPEHRLKEALSVLKPLRALLRDTRSQLLAHHANDFSAEQLDAEVGRKALVTAAGGGGGAGYVYIGAAARLRREGRSSDYLVGASIGALIGAFLARRRELDLNAILDWAKGLSAADIFGPPQVGAGYTLPGIARLHLQAMHRTFQNEDGSPMRLADLEIPYDAVISGLHQRAYEHLPASLRRLVSPRQREKGFARLVAERMMMLPSFVSPQVTKPLVLGRDAETAQIRVVDAVGLSAAIPAVLQYEPEARDPASDDALAALRERERVALFVDGGVTANVPARLAWEGVQAGRIGTRNAFILALDCFAPQSDPQHLWLWPVTQAIQLQLPPQRPYFDWLVGFRPTLSPVNLLPAAADFDGAYQWGWDQVDTLVPMLLKALEPVPWPD